MAKKSQPINLPPSSTFSFAAATAPCIIIHGEGNKKILEIEFDGTVVWHAEDQASEAADVFCKQLSLGIEHKAGIRKTREEWEHDKYLAIKEALDNGELTIERLAEIFKKNEFMRKLAGEDSE